MLNVSKATVNIYTGVFWDKMKASVACRHFRILTKNVGKKVFFRLIESGQIFWNEYQIALPTFVCEQNESIHLCTQQKGAEMDGLERQQWQNFISHLRADTVSSNPTTAPRFRGACDWSTNFSVDSFCWHSLVVDRLIAEMLQFF